MKSNDDKLIIRHLKSDDFDALVHLDSVLLGSEKRRQYWEKKFAIFRLRRPNLSLVAIHNDHLIGYIMGNISGWEFGISAGVGWIELMGVHPDDQKKGIGRKMTEELLRQFKSLDVKTVITMIRSDDVKIRNLFKSMSFEEGRMVQIEKHI